jgi:hypothetical protein
VPDDAPPPVKVDRRRGPRPPGTVVGKPFEKGTSGNPGGLWKKAPVRKKRVRSLLAAIANESPVTIEEALQAAGPMAVRLMVDTIADKKEATRDRLYAARTIIDKLKANALAKAEGDEEAKKKTALEEFVEAIRAKPPTEGVT